MLTRKQYELLLFIHDRLKDTGIPPSFDEMKEALDLASKSGIHRLITALEERGFIRRLPNRARALEVLRLPETLISSVKTPKKPLSDSGQMSTTKLNTKSSNISEQINDHIGANINIPVMGRIAAGVPISAIQQQTNMVSISPDMIGSGEHYALEVKGDSMIEAGILDGDTIIVRKISTATPGEIIVALVDDEEATLKRYRKQGTSIALEAANQAYETRVFDAGRIKVQGRLVGLIRRY